MQFKLILLSAIMALLGSFTVTATFDADFCTPSVNQNTCVLTFQTGGDIIVEENGQPSIGEVNIYSPSCNLWGSKVLYSSNPTSILAWGLSIKNPVLFIPVYVPGVGYGQPKFEYEGDEYGPGDCDCVLGPTDGSHECLCRFACIPCLIDSVAMVDLKMG